MGLDLQLLMDCNKETAVDQWPINLIMNPEHAIFNRQETQHGASLSFQLGAFASQS